MFKSFDKSKEKKLSDIPISVIILEMHKKGNSAGRTDFKHKSRLEATLFETSSGKIIRRIKKNKVNISINYHR